MPRKKNRKRLVPGAEQALEKFKMEIAGELGILDGSPGMTLESALEKYKHEIAGELGIDSYIKNQGWQDVSSGKCGAVGGRMGGRIGGNMVKRMIEMAEKQMSGQ
ncbi:alpha/beta-type small acid-soluble spore protein [Dethiobacter alkaliphilus]|uniref:Small acid-soluble spore protein alpha/beta type n=1 Tax=Dethiobacter alkaliphilus AHT 1 TaxID=555088 RepID=C0GIS9_DETAL|nr:alpha/beta-type small acid-soluble spore protein [Dethiobacter alkaliphilus]EEG76743.1 small acid-soluble spore protein alpha/beta type [Dethiobacter alkaliphilus AHT 1]MCW3490871.1 alpha/beta-type small acid-soluble spore protein [Dethiobacter alkaliphilus]